ncbi:hypothetical protein [Undibacterium sp. Ren11W]|uniref:LuxE/PaaK family acyltransferase n=1 Tax=Undibacterium sp. Ren11W TaxID=3413045 RepID=UPI003BF38C7F
MNQLNNLMASPQLLLAKAHILGQNSDNAVDRLYQFDSFNKDEKWKTAFFAAMRETLHIQYQDYDFYRKLMRLADCELASFQCFEDLLSIPYISSSVLKKYTLSSTALEAPTLNILSSGTSGQKAEITIDETSLVRIVAGILKVYGEFGLASPEPANYLFAGYSPDASNGAGTAGTDSVVSHLTPSLANFYALDLDAQGRTVFLLEQAVETLRAYVLTAKPIRILGFLHYSCEIIKAYHHKYGEVKFPDDSYILSGGGWKEFAHLYGEDFNLYAYLTRFSNMPASAIRDSYSLVEHPALYVACEKNKLHVSALAHVVIRDLRSMEELAHGETGLVQLFTPILQSYPSASLLSSDLGYLEQHCACGRVGDYLTITGRGGSKKAMSCALHAEQYLAKDHHAQ